MRKLSRINLIVISLLNSLVIVYVYIIGTFFCIVPVTIFMFYTIFLIGFICGVISLVVFMYFGRTSDEKLAGPVISVFLSFLVIPHLFAISLVYFFTMN